MIAVWLALIIVSIAALSAWVYALSNQKKLIATREELDATIATLQQDIKSIQNSNMGLGQTLLSVEKKLNTTVERQEQQLEASSNDFAFDRAAMLADDVDASQLSKRFGLPEAEAELMSLMRHTKPTETSSIHE